MNLTLVDRIANAVLYEGYMLYPYRASAVKNRQRWNFGAVYPETFSSASGGTDACVMQTQCLVVGKSRTSIDVKVKFIHLLARDVSVLEEGGSRIVESLEVNGRLCQTWQEAVEREAGANKLEIGELCERSSRTTFSFSSSREDELLHDGAGKIAGVIVRRQQSIEGALDVSAERIGDRLFRITARISNLTSMNLDAPSSRDEALMRALVSTHTILGVRDGEVRIAPRSAGIAARAGVCLQQHRHLSRAGRRRRARFDVVIADYSLRLSADCAGERGRTVRLHGDRRDIDSTDNDADRRRET